MICVLICFFFFKQKPAYEMRISDWSSDVCSSDLRFELVDARGFAEIVPVYGDVDILGKALDEAVRLRKRGAALEEQPWLVGAALMIELVQRPADPEILLDIAERRAKPVRGRQEQVPAMGFSRPDALLVAGAGHARRPQAGVTSSRRESCIQIGSA